MNDGKKKTTKAKQNQGGDTFDRMNPEHRQWLSYNSIDFPLVVQEVIIEEWEKLHKYPPRSIERQRDSLNRLRVLSHLVVCGRISSFKNVVWDEIILRLEERHKSMQIQDFSRMTESLRREYTEDYVGALFEERS